MTTDNKHIKNSAEPIAESSRETRRFRIFLVDDHPVFTRGLRDILNAEPDMECCGESDGSNNVIAQLRTANADMVIMDVSLRGLNGMDLVKQLKVEMPEMTILVLSMHDESLYSERALRAGACGYVMKDQPPEQITGAIRRVLSGDLVVSERSAHSLLRRLVHGKSVPPRSNQRVQASDFNLGHLSDREMEIFELMGHGVTTRDCASKLKVSAKTIETYQARIRTKLGLSDGHQLRHHATVWASLYRERANTEQPSIGAPAAAANEDTDD